VKSVRRVGLKTQTHQNGSKAREIDRTAAGNVNAPFPLVFNLPSLPREK
jgi:hypothetical protein